MKILKIVLLSLAGLIVLILVAGLFVNNEYAVKREVIIEKPKQEVFDYIKLLKKQDEYAIWTKEDPNTKKSFTGTDGTIGAIATWESENKNVGKGEQEITGIKEGERIDYELRFIEPMEAKDHAYFTLEAIDSTHTKVVWGFDGRMDYPMNLFLLTFDMEEMLGGALQKGLDNLKAILEKK